MPDIPSLLELLKSDDYNKRYEACEQLRVWRHQLPQEAIDALNLVTNDENPYVADAAQRALALHILQVKEIVEIPPKNPVKSNGISPVVITLLVVICLLIATPAGFLVVASFITYNLFPFWENWGNSLTLLAIAFMVGFFFWYTRDTVRESDDKQKTKKNK